MMGGKSASGYTIVEIMIFLAVTSALFLIAMLTIGGQQAKTDFAQGTRDFQASVEDTINDIRNGNFPQVANLECTTPDSGPPHLQLIVSDVGQGKNKDCTYAGKVIDFTGTSADVYSVAARRLSGSGNEVKDFSEAKPTARSDIGLNEIVRLTGGMRVTKLIVKKDAATASNDTYKALGFFHSFTDTTTQSVTNDNDIIVVPLMHNNDTQVMVETLETDGDANKNPMAIAICIQQGDNGPVASLFIGVDGARTTTQTHINDANTATEALFGSGFTCS